MIVDAIIRNFEIIGEASRNIPDEIKSKYLFIEWKEMAAFRNVLIHGYFDLDIEAIWDTLQNNIPTLKRHIEELREKECE